MPTAVEPELLDTGEPPARRRSLRAVGVVVLAVVAVAGWRSLQNPHPSAAAPSQAPAVVPAAPTAAPQRLVVASGYTVRVDPGRHVAVAGIDLENAYPSAVVVDQVSVGRASLAQPATKDSGIRATVMSASTGLARLDAPQVVAALPPLDDFGVVVGALGRVTLVLTIAPRCSQANRPTHPGVSVTYDDDGSRTTQQLADLPELNGLPWQDALLRIACSVG